MLPLFILQASHYPLLGSTDAVHGQRVPFNLLLPGSLIPAPLDCTQPTRRSPHLPRPRPRASGVCGAIQTSSPPQMHLNLSLDADPAFGLLKLYFQSAFGLAALAQKPALRLIILDPDSKETPLPPPQSHTQALLGQYTQHHRNSSSNTYRSPFTNHILGMKLLIPFFEKILGYTKSYWAPPNATCPTPPSPTCTRPADQQPVLIPNATSNQAPNPVSFAQSGLSEGLDPASANPLNEAPTGSRPPSSTTTQRPADGSSILSSGITASIFSSEHSSDVQAMQTQIPVDVPQYESSTTGVYTTETFKNHPVQTVDTSVPPPMSVGSDTTPYISNPSNGSETDSATTQVTETASMAAATPSTIPSGIDLDIPEASLADSEQDQDQDIQGTLILLHELMDSIKNNVEMDCLQAAVCSLQDILDNGCHTEKDRARVEHHLVRALLTRYGLHGWIEDLDDFTVRILDAFENKDVGSTLAAQNDDQDIIEIQVASQLIQACRSSLDIETVDTVICIASEAISGPACSIVNSQNVDVLIILGNAIIMKYLTQDGIAELDQAATKFREAYSTTDCVSLKVVSSLSLAYIESLRLVEGGEIAAFARLQDSLKKVVEIDDEAEELGQIGAEMAEGAIDDGQLRDAIILLTNSLHLRKAPNPRRASILKNLGLARLARFRVRGSFEDLDECIFLHREALNLQPTPHPSRPLTLNNLANTLSIRFKEKKSFRDLADCILLYREALNLYAAHHPNRASVLSNLASALSTRFALDGAFEDLEECILFYREAFKLQPGPHPSRSSSLHTLASALFIRFQRKGAFRDLEDCILLHREALHLHPAPHPNRSASLASLASALSTRFRQQGAIKDLEECIILNQEALNLQPGHPSTLNNLANALLTRFEQNGRFQDLEGCIQLYEEALNPHSATHPHRLGLLSNLASALSIRFEKTGAFQDLEKCILLYREALHLYPASHPNRSGILTNLAISLLIRFERKGTSQDFEESISLHREALSLHPGTHPNRSCSLRSLANALSTRFEQKGMIKDLDECILLYQEALGLQPTSHPDRSSSLNNLAKALSTRFERKGASRDIEECILLYREALSLRPKPHPGRPSSLINLATGLWARLEKNGASENLDECILLHWEALDLLSAPHPDRSFDNLASILFNWYDRNGDLQNGNIILPPSLHDLFHHLHPHIDHSQDRAVVQFVLQCYEEASKYETGSLIMRMKSAKNWAVCARKYHPSSSLDAHRYAVSLIPLLASLDLTLQQRQDVLLQNQALAGDAAKSAIMADQYEAAVVFLSTGRSVFWSQALQLRTPIDNLAVAHPALAQRFSELSRQLEHASYSSQLPVSPAIPNIYPSLHALADQWRQTIEEIRKTPGFEGFLEPPTFASLQSAASNGPVVLLNASTLGCDALIIHRGEPVEHIPLSVHLGELEALKILLHALITQAEMRTIIPQDMRDILQGLLGRDLVVREGPSILNEDTFQLALGWLWTRVVQLVLEALALTKSDSPSRIWWCPTGPFSSLPIHAAGIYSEDNKPVDCVFQYAVSSYCTSPQDLLHPEPQIAEGFKMMAVIEPDAPGAAPLPATLQELWEIEKHIPDHRRHLIAHIGSKASPTPFDDLLSDIQQSSFTHFGCHGMQHLTDPLESSLLLSGGRLTMSKIIKECRVPEGALAYLSACETAKGDETRPNESLNLVATMMFAGFRSVVGTMWSIFDVDAPVVADVFYGHLFRHGNEALPDVRDAAYGLHLATQELRERGNPFRSWVPYVHYGI